MNIEQIIRIRKLLIRVLYTLGAIAVAAAICIMYGLLIEPHWLKIRHVVIGNNPDTRIVLIADIHYKGDRDYLEKVIDRVNDIEADFVCFAGDLIENGKYLDEALEIMASINKPLYGVPGNHDYWADVSFDGINELCSGTGGEWLCDKATAVQNDRIEIVGSTGAAGNWPAERIEDAEKRILLVHYPSMVKNLKEKRFDLIMAGHSHGGQVRLPFIGDMIVPYDVRPYGMGLSKTDAGPLYVNPGIGTFFVEFRFLCRPEITVIEF